METQMVMIRIRLLYFFMGMACGAVSTVAFQAAMISGS